MIPTKHRLVVLVTAFIACSNVILRQRIRIVAVSCWIIREDFLADRTDAAQRYDIARERITDIRRALTNGSYARMGGHGIVDFVLSEVLSASQEVGHRV